MRQFVIFSLLVCISLAYMRVTAYIPTTLIGTTYELEAKNNSIILLDTSNANLTKRYNFANPWDYVSSTIDVRNRKFYLLGDQSITRINADTFLPERVLGVGNLQDIQYDYTLGKMFALQMNTDSTSIVSVDLNTGVGVTVINFNMEDGVFEGGFACDQKNHRYFLSSQDSNQNYYVLAIDTNAGKILGRINATAFLEELQYDPLSDRLVGMDGANLCAIENITVGQKSVTKVLTQIKGGLSNLYGAAIDPLNNRYIVNLIGETGSQWASVDLTTNEIVYQSNFFANIHNVQLLPTANN